MTNIQTVIFLICFCLLSSQQLDPDFQCPSPDGLFPSPTSCKEYYNCGGDAKAWKYECPGETLWDDTTKIVYIISLLFYNILLYYYYIIIILLLYYYL